MRGHLIFVLTMQTHELYLPMLIPLWGIFIGIALVIIGFVDKKAHFTYFGWSVFIVLGLVSLYYNLFQIVPSHFTENNQLSETAALLMNAGWLNVAGALLALATLLFFYFKRKRYLLMAILTILFFAVQFFQYYSLIQKPK
jgi:LPXTG-motif cell wall-anchored protein